MTVAYRRRKMDASFRADWVEKIAIGYQRLEAVLMERAFNGTERVITKRDGSEERMREYGYQLRRRRRLGKAESLAAFTSGGWRFVTPVEGMSVYVKTSGSWANYRLGTWEIGTLRGSSVVVGGQQVVGSRGAAIPSAIGGTTVDSQVRAAADQILAALRQHGLIDL